MTPEIWMWYRSLIAVLVPMSSVFSQKVGFMPCINTSGQQVKLWYTAHKTTVEPRGRESLEARHNPLIGFLDYILCTKPPKIYIAFSIWKSLYPSLRERSLLIGTGGGGIPRFRRTQKLPPLNTTRNVGYPESGVWHFCHTPDNGIGSLHTQVKTWVCKEPIPLSGVWQKCHTPDSG